MQTDGYLYLLEELSLLIVVHVRRVGALALLHLIGLHLLGLADLLVILVAVLPLAHGQVPKCWIGKDKVIS